MFVPSFFVLNCVRPEHLAGENDQLQGAWHGLVTGALGGAARHAQAGKGREPPEPAGARAQPRAHRKLGG